MEKEFNQRLDQYCAFVDQYVGEVQSVELGLIDWGAQTVFVGVEILCMGLEFLEKSYYANEGLNNDSFFEKAKEKAKEWSNLTSDYLKGISPNQDIIEETKVVASVVAITKSLAQLLKGAPKAMTQNGDDVTAALNGAKESLDDIGNIVVNGDGTLLHLAASEGTPEMIEYLVKAGSDNNRVEREWSPLHWAVSFNKPENAKKLIELGAEVNSETSVNSSLLGAIHKDSLEMVKMIVEAGADITYQFKTRDNPWWDALSYAKYYKAKEIYKYLEKQLKEKGIKIKDIPPKAAEIQKVRETYFEDYIEKYLGPIAESYTEEELLQQFWGSEKQVKNDVRIDIHLIMPSKERDYITLITAGMSEEPMAETDAGLKYAEVMMKLPKSWKTGKALLTDEAYNWPLKILTKTAYLGHLIPGSYLDEEVMIPYGNPNGAPDYFDWDKEFTTVMLCKSEDIEAYDVDEKTKIQFFTLIPISEEEKELVNEKGSQAVKEMLQSGEVVDMDREYLVPPEGV